MSNSPSLASGGTDVVPCEFVCPISHDAMTDPVVAPDGNTYERAAIEKWLREHGTSPLTREPMRPTALLPNRNLRDAIATYNQQHHSARSAAAPTPAAPRAAVAGREAISAAATLSVSDVKFGSRRDCLLTVTPPAGDASQRAPANLVLVIDTSRSMAKEATAIDADGHSEDTGLCVLDIVKHAALTICEMLGEQDKIAIVDFSTNARPGPLVAANAAGKATVKSTLAGMVPNGSTNLWAGIQAAVEIAKQPALTQAAHRNSNTSIFVLTDGLPTVTPPSGYPRSLERYLPTVCDGPAPFTISTFGFGYRLDSAMLSGVASVGHGSFSFIPDAGLVGTVFVNAVAALLTTLSPVTRVKVNLPKNTRVEPKAAHLDAVATVNTAVNRDGGTTATIDIGATQYGQPRHIAFTVGPVAAPVGGDSDTPSRAPVSASLFLGTGKHVSGTIDVTIESNNDTNNGAAAWTEHALRQAFVALVPELDLSARAAGMMDSLRANIGIASCSSALAAALLKDLEGEIALGISTKEHFDRWAPHYFRSIAAANRCETCNNFKDHSVQRYGGDLFKSVQSAGELSFLGIAAPEPTRLDLTPSWQLAAQMQQQQQQRPPSGGGRQQAGSPAAPRPNELPTRTAPRRAMNWAYDRGGGRFAPSCEVALAGGRGLPASEVRAGDTLHDGRSVVECVVRVRIDRDVSRLVTFKSGLAISRFHPVKLDGVWIFPANAPAALVENACTAPDFDHLYSFVLRDADGVGADVPGGVMVAGQLVAPFAHGCGRTAAGDDDDEGRMGALPHPFFGDRNAVVAALKAGDAGAAYAEGAVEVMGFRRDDATNCIIGLVTSE